MSFWTDFRDGLEAVAAIALNFFYPGSGMITSQLVSEGAQNFLSPGGKTGWLGSGLMMASGLGGMGTGQMANYGSTMNAMSNMFGGADAAAGGVSGITTLNADPNMLQEARSLIDSGMTPDAAIQQVGLSPAQAQSAGIPVSGAAPVFDVDPMAGGGYGSPTGPGYTGAATLAGKGAMAPMGEPQISQAVNAASQGAGAMPWSSPGIVSNVLGGIQGIMQARKQPNFQEMRNMADPFNQYRGEYGERLKRIMADPSAIQNEPGYQAGLQAVQRSLAAQGYTGSGNALAAISRYGGDFFNKTVDRYSQLAGGNVNPGQGAQMGMMSQNMQNQGYANALGQLGYAGVMAGNRWPWQGQQRQPGY